MPESILTPVNSKPPRSGSTAKSSYRPVRIERGRILTVNINDYTVTVRTEMPPYKPKFDIPWMNPYCHFSQGEGINFMPEVGSTCWVCEPSEDGRESFVMGWVMPDEGGAYRAGRELLNPGDIYLSTRDGNFVTLRRGGVVQIGATPVCQRVFIPIRNIIQDFGENYELHTPAGDLTWSVLRKDEDGDGHQRALLTIAAHEFADDPVDKDPIALLKIGSHGDGDDTILTLITRDKGGGDVKIKLLLNKSGDLTWTVEGQLSMKSTKAFSMASSDTMDFTSDKDMTLTSKGKFTGKASKAMTFQTDDDYEVKATGNIKIDGKKVNLGDAKDKVVVYSSDMMQWMQQVTTAISSTNAVSPTSATPLLPSLQMPTSHTSSKVKA